MDCSTIALLEKHGQSGIVNGFEVLPFKVNTAFILGFIAGSEACAAF